MKANYLFSVAAGVIMAATSASAAADCTGTVTTVKNPDGTTSTVYVPGTCPPPVYNPIPSPSPTPAPVVNNGGAGGAGGQGGQGGDAAAIAAAQAAAIAAANSNSSSAAQANNSTKVETNVANVAEGGKATATGGNAVAAGGNTGPVSNVNGGNNVNFSTPRNAPSISPSSVGAGVVGCYDKNGYSVVLSTTYQIAAVGFTMSTDAKEIPGCEEKANKKIAGTIGLQSDDPAKIVLGAAALGLTAEMNHLKSAEGQAEMALFAQRQAPQQYTTTAAPTPVTVVLNGAARAEAPKVELPPCVIPGHKASWKANGTTGTLICSPDNN